MSLWGSSARVMPLRRRARARQVNYSINQPINQSAKEKPHILHNLLEHHTLLYSSQKIRKLSFSNSNSGVFTG